MSRVVAVGFLAVAMFIVHGCGGDEFTANPQASGGSAGAAGSGGKAGAGGVSSAGSTSTGGNAGSAGQGRGGSPAIGGSPPLAGAPPMAGSAGSGGASGGTAGTSNDCSAMPLCQTCCDELYPDLHAVFANAFYSCSCDVCYSACQDSLCVDTYSWSDSCLECLQAYASTTCSDAAVACDGTPDCEAFAACSFSCL